jgi:uncharacterized iron-regulated protein
MVSELWTEEKTMNIRRLYIWAIGAIGAVLLLVSGSNALQLTNDQQQILQSLRSANITYLGETHDSTTDHQDQLTILQNLRQKGPKLAIGLEMFQKPFQGALDRYLAGQISETELQAQSEYQKRWGFPWENYAPLLRLAKEQRIPVIALNTPTEITRKVAKQGLASLQGDDLKYIPPLAEIDRSNTAYRDRIFASYRQHQLQATTNSKSFDRFYEAQILWDETMAAAAATFYRQNPQSRLVIIAGQAHISYGHGIPSRLRRRLSDLKTVQKSVILSSDETWDPAIADFRFRAIAPSAQKKNRQ